MGLPPVPPNLGKNQHADDILVVVKYSKTDKKFEVEFFENVRLNKNFNFTRFEASFNSEITFQLFFVNKEHVCCSNPHIFKYINPYNRIYTPIKNGLLYNYFALQDSRMIVKPGWHVATESDFGSLTGNNDPGRHNGGTFKSTDLEFWNSPNLGATNQSNFNARGSGYRNETGVFSGLKETCNFWADFFMGNSFCYGWKLSSSNDDLYHDFINMNCGLSLRVVKDWEPGIQNIKEFAYVGNDEKVYPCVNFGNIIFTSINLAETKFVNGDLIPVVDDPTEWAKLQTAGCCAYNNDFSNL
ncbi:MAG: FISUMP domain-containing protein [Bacteroidales bacterium]